ncbi:D-TA family PLP-dependent enzyme [Euzebyella saccharophila]|uniref:D-TA family PLP-dependent enzyme n=1 Tax=Euzebyella saccharophila TaxID=679664 RepID=A0ABV8JQR1_9FLAO|nr:D-TA family PLP-dependent enzyme [Euzebyella saccharophila]
MILKDWYCLHNPEETITPALLVSPKAIRRNIDLMIEMAGSVKNLRPHIKTHKTAEIINMQLESGIQKFKCATIAEAELLAQNKAKDVLLAMQPVGANIDRFLRLMKTCPQTEFSTLVDHPSILKKISDTADKEKMSVSLWLDINNGMNRTGISPNNHAFKLYKSMTASSRIAVMGLHVYDGHLRNTDFEQRKKDCDRAFQSVMDFKNSLEKEGLAVPSIVAGGSPTFPFHCLREGVETSPGTTLLWDAGYGNSFPEMKFKMAAVLATRVLSKPKEDILCLDLGHKWLAPEMGFPRVQFLNEDSFEQVGQSEEHFVINTNKSEAYQIGDIVYAIPQHICPTVAKYDYLQVVENNEIVGSWKVAARNQSIHI